MPMFPPRASTLFDKLYRPNPVPKKIEKNSSILRKKLKKNGIKKFNLILELKVIRYREWSETGKDEEDIVRKEKEGKVKGEKEKGEGERWRKGVN